MTFNRHHTLIGKRPVQRTNDATEPPEECLLLRDARAALVRGEHRRALFDAATGAEVVIAAALTNRLELALGEKAAARILAVERNISVRIGLAQALCINLTPSLHAELFEMRNSAIHRNAAISRLEVGRALDVAHQVVGNVTPTP